MKRGWLLGVGLLVAGAGAVLWGTMASKQAPPPTQRPAQTPRFFDLGSVPLFPSPTPAMQKLQWLADEAGCPASDNPALMASCVRQKLWKGREKARQRLERYEALVGLDREYWRNLHREGLVPLTVHVMPGWDGLPDSH